MKNSSFRGGASIHARTVQPSIDLAAVIACLVEAIPTPKNKDERPLFSMPLLEYFPKRGELRIQTTPILSRLKHHLAHQRLKPKKGGFFRDVSVPSRGRVWLGGSITSGTEREFKSQLIRLSRAIDEELDKLCGRYGVSVEQFYVPAFKEHLESVAKKLKVDFDLFSNRSSIAPIILSGASPNATHRKRDLARAISGKERMLGNKTTHLRQMTDAVGRLLRYDGGQTPDEQEEILKQLHQTSLQSNSQLNLFLNFLEQDALSHLRLQVSFKIMDAIATDAERKYKKSPNSSDHFRHLASYVKRAKALFKLLAGPDAKPYKVKLEQHFPEGSFLLNEEFSKVGFYRCFPVWCEWNAQIFEHREVEAEPPSSLREITYRFKINGDNPEKRCSAFEARLDKIRTSLALGKGESYFVKRNLAELVVLGVLSAEEQDETDGRSLEDLVETQVRSILSYLEREGVEGVKNALKRLAKRKTHIDLVAKGLIASLRTRGERLFDTTSQKTWEFLLHVNRSILDLGRIIARTGNPLRVDMKWGGGKADFHRYIEVDESPNPLSLFSIPIEVKLCEYSLNRVSDPRSYEFSRECPERGVVVIWNHHQVGEDWKLYPGESTFETWRPSHFVHMEYSDRYLQKSKRKTDEQAKHLLAAYRTAFTVLSYLTLQRLMSRIPTTLAKPTMLLLRMQEEGRTEEGNSATELVYAASQAVEMVMNREFQCKVQGLIHSDDRGTLYKERNVLAALISAFPVVIQRNDPPTLEKVAILSFSARPCDTTLENLSGEDEAYLFLLKTYLMESKKEASVSTIRTDHIRMGLDLNHLITEELRRLVASGCRQVIFLSRRFGERRVGRSDVRQRFQDDPAFLEHLHEHFGDEIVLYPIVRDTFPATRLSTKKKENGFEILDPQGYQVEGFISKQSDFTPIYTVATLTTIGRDESKKPQSGFSTYFLLNDRQSADRTRTTRAAGNILLPELGLRPDLLMALRGVHLLECEKMPAKNGVEPILDPYKWMQPDSIEGVGEFRAMDSRRKSGEILLSLPAILHRVSAVIREESMK